MQVSLQLPAAEHPSALTLVKEGEAEGMLMWALVLLHMVKLFMIFGSL